MSRLHCIVTNKQIVNYVSIFFLCNFLLQHSQFNLTPNHFYTGTMTIATIIATIRRRTSRLRRCRGRAGPASTTPSRRRSTWTSQTRETALPRTRTTITTRITTTATTATKAAVVAVYRRPCHPWPPTPRTTAPRRTRSPPGWPPQCQAGRRRQCRRPTRSRLYRPRCCSPPAA